MIILLMSMVAVLGAGCAQTPNATEANNGTITHITYNVDNSSSLTIAQQTHEIATQAEQQASNATEQSATQDTSPDISATGL